MMFMTMNGRALMCKYRYIDLALVYFSPVVSLPPNLGIEIERYTNLTYRSNTHMTKFLSSPNPKKRVLGL